MTESQERALLREAAEHLWRMPADLRRARRHWDMGATPEDCAKRIDAFLALPSETPAQGDPHDELIFDGQGEQEHSPSESEEPSAATVVGPLPAAAGPMLKVGDGLYVTLPAEQRRSEKEQPDVLAAERKAVLELARQFARDILISEGFYTRAAVSVAQQFLEADAEREDLRAELDKALEENDAMAKDYLELGRRLEAAQSAMPRIVSTKPLEELIELAETAGYSDEFIGNVVRASLPQLKPIAGLDGGNERKER